MDSDETCFEKATANGETTFTLRSQDVTADLVVDFWISCQVEVKQHMDDGMTMVQAVEEVRREFLIPGWGSFAPMEDLKLAQAQQIGKAMNMWVNRKLAD